MGKLKSKHKRERYTPILPIKESFSSSISELPLFQSNYVDPTSLQSYLQLATPHKEWYYPCNPECIVCIPPPSFHWLQGLSKTGQLIASSTLLSDLANHFRKHEYNAIIQVINSSSINGFDRETSVYLHFGIACAYYELKHFTHARNHLSECKLVASGAGDVSLCYSYLGKIASASHSHRKAAKHYHKAALCCQESSLAKKFNLTQPSCSALHHQSALEFRLVNCFPQALDELKQAIKTAQTKEEYFLAHYDRGKLYQVMANHTMALDDFELAGELAEELGDCVAAKRAYKDAYGACLMLNRIEEAWQFFECSLTCVSIDCRKCSSGSEQRLLDLKWICDVIGHLLIHIPDAFQYINGLMNEWKEDEGDRPNVCLVIVEKRFPVPEPSKPLLVLPFVELVDKQPQTLCEVDIPTCSTGHPSHRSNPTLLSDEIQTFSWCHPHFKSDHSLIESECDSSD